MKSLVLAISATVLLGVSQSPALAALVSFGTAEAVTARDCILEEELCIGISTPPSILLFGGSPGGTSSTASFNSSDYGRAFGSVSLSGVIGAPILKTLAESKMGKRVNTNSVALQRYVYEGSEPVTRTFAAELTYSQSLTYDYDQYEEGKVVLSGVYAAIWIFKTGSEFINVGESSESNFDALFQFPFLAERYDGTFVDLGFDQFLDSKPEVLNGRKLLSVTVELNPGDAIWVYALLQTPAANGSWVDASNTLVTAWDDPKSLVPAAQVPEPSTIGLLAWGLLGFGVTAAASRRRATQLRHFRAHFGSDE